VKDVRGWSRRDALRSLVAASVALGTARGRAADVPAIVAGPLQAPDANGVALPAGFVSRVVARSGEPAVAGGEHEWHGAPDGGACFATPGGGWIYVSNSELEFGRGGVGALRFDRRGRVLANYPILTGTTQNCAGGATPWRTWLSCEEREGGLVWECDPRGRRAAEPRPALGAFVHEAIAVDVERGHLYLTEDMPDGLWYRYVPAAGLNGARSLRAGTLEAAVVDEARQVSWVPVPDPAGEGRRTRDQLPQATRFAGGEGIWCERGQVWFTTKHDNRVWRYDIAAARLTVLYDANTAVDPILSGVDNCVLAANGDLLVCEDGGDMQIVAVRPDGSVLPVLQLRGHSHSEIAGVAFDPSGRRLYFSSQRGSSGRNGGGITYEISGPFG
jgi:uncharacterized protein